MVDSGEESEPELDKVHEFVTYLEKLGLCLGELVGQRAVSRKESKPKVAVHGVKQFEPYLEQTSDWKL